MNLPWAIEQRLLPKGWRWRQVVRTTDPRLTGLALDIPVTLFSGTRTFYTAATSGGTVDVLNTVVVESGFIKSWTQSAPAGTPAGWQFDDAANSGHAMLTWD